jgi:hypothetical protein
MFLLGWKIVTETSATLYHFSGTYWPWGGTEYYTSKRGSVSTSQHGLTYQQCWM